MPAILTAFGLLCSLCTLAASFGPPPGREPLPDGALETQTVCAACLLFWALIWTVIETKGYIESNFTLTNRRIILEEGGFRRRSLDMYLKRIDSLFVEQSLLGKLLGYGTINVRGGSDKPWRFKIANAEYIRNQIQEQIARQ